MEIIKVVFFSIVKTLGISLGILVPLLFTLAILKFGGADEFVSTVLTLWYIFTGGLFATLLIVGLVSELK